MGLVSILPARQADRVIISVTLVGFAASIAWLRLRVAGWRGMPLASLLAALLALNVTWLFGFTSFLLGACLFAITLGVWWEGRERLRIGRAAVLAVLLVCGYFAHLVSLGLTVVGLAILTALTPGERRLARAGMTAASLVPLVPLGLFYLRLSGRGGPLHADWEHRVSLFSIRSWVDRLGWVDPISLASRLSLPFAGVEVVGVRDAGARWSGRRRAGDPRGLDPLECPGRSGRPAPRAARLARAGGAPAARRPGRARLARHRPRPLSAAAGEPPRPGGAWCPRWTST